MSDKNELYFYCVTKSVFCLIFVGLRSGFSTVSYLHKKFDFSCSKSRLKSSVLIPDR